MYFALVPHGRHISYLHLGVGHITKPMKVSTFSRVNAIVGLLLPQELAGHWQRHLRAGTAVRAQYVAPRRVARCPLPFRLKKAAYRQSEDVSLPSHCRAYSLTELF